MAARRGAPRPDAYSTTYLWEYSVCLSIASKLLVNSIEETTYHLLIMLVGKNPTPNIPNIEVLDVIFSHINLDAQDAQFGWDVHACVGWIS